MSLAPATRGAPVLPQLFVFVFASSPPLRPSAFSIFLLDQYVLGVVDLYLKEAGHGKDALLLNNLLFEEYIAYLDVHVVLS